MVADDPSYSGGAFATVGIRDQDGHLSGRNVLWSHNQASISNGENILFTRTNHAPVSLPDTVSTQSAHSDALSIQVATTPFFTQSATVTTTVTR